MKWTKSQTGEWRWSAGVPVAYVRPYNDGRGLWSWDMDTGELAIGARRLYKTASGARAACERVARRLGVVC